MSDVSCVGGGDVHLHEQAHHDAVVGDLQLPRQDVLTFRDNFINNFKLSFRSYSFSRH